MFYGNSISKLSFSCIVSFFSRFVVWTSCRLEKLDTLQPSFCVFSWVLMILQTRPLTVLLNDFFVFGLLVGHCFYVLLNIFEILANFI